MKVLWVCFSENGEVMGLCVLNDFGCRLFDILVWKVNFYFVNYEVICIVELMCIKRIGFWIILVRIMVWLVVFILMIGGWDFVW